MRINLTKPQTEFLDLSCKYPLFVGGYGSGKSFALTTSAITDLYLHQSVRIAVYSDTYDQLRLNLVPRFEELFEEANIPYGYNKSENTISVMHGKKKNDIIFRSVDNPKRIIGYEVFRSHVDELEAAGNEKKAFEVWRKIIARNRQNIDGHINKVSVYTTPDQGYGFTYKQWGQSKSENYQYVVAPTETNPHNPDDYLNTLLESYPTNLAEAYTKGLWCNLNHGSVYPYFSRENNHTDEAVKDGEPLHIGMDFNVRNMSAVIHNEKGYAVAELIGYLDTPTMIREIKEKYPRHVITIYPDASGASASSKGAALTDIRMLKEAGFYVKCKKINPRVRDRINVVNRRFESGQGKINTKECPQTVEAIEQQSYTDKGDPDKEAGYDHACDAYGYHAAYRYPLRAKLGWTHVNV